MAIYLYLCLIMTGTLITNNILLFFVQGAYFLLTAIFASKLLLQYRVHIKLYLGILLFFWILLSIKDLIIYHTPFITGDQYFNYILMIDQLAVPLSGIFLLELLKPKSLSLLKFSFNILPFITLLTIYYYIPSLYIIVGTIINTIIYSLIITVITILHIYKTSVKQSYNKIIATILFAFLSIFVSWVISCIYPSALLDTAYYVISGIAWYIIYYNIENTYPLDNSEPIHNSDIETVIKPATHKKEYQFTTLLNKLFEQDHIYLNPELTLNDVARLIGTNRSYLSDYFNHECNTSFNDYINNLRLTHAENLLTTQHELPIEEIASAAGFNSISTFRRAFIKRHELTPSQYRQKLLTRQKSHQDV